MAAIPIRAESNAYSTRSWPASSATRPKPPDEAFRERAQRGKTLPALLGAGHLVVHPREQVVDATRHELHRHDARERDERREQRVFDQVLAVVLAHEAGRQLRQGLHCLSLSIVVMSVSSVDGLSISL